MTIEPRGVDLSHGLAWALLELLCRGLDEPERKAAFAALLADGDLDWGELLEQAIRHKLLFVLALEVTKPEYREHVSRLVNLHLQTALDANRRLTALYRAEAAQIVERFGSYGLEFAFTKGITFESTIYGGTGACFLGDIDLMVKPEDRDDAAEALRSLAYEPGYYDWPTGSVVAHSRRDLITYRLNPDHLPIFAKRLSDAVVRFVHVDVANSLTWWHSPYVIPVEAALAGARHQPLPGFSGVRLPRFSPPFQFIFTALHLFREAWFVKWLEWEQDVNLTKFGELIRLWDSDLDEQAVSELRELVSEFEIAEPLAWVLEHLDRTFGTDLVTALELGGKLDEARLLALLDGPGTVGRLQGTMRERLYSKDRGKLRMAGR